MLDPRIIQFGTVRVWYSIIAPTLGRARGDAWLVDVSIIAIWEYWRRGVAHSTICPARPVNYKAEPGGAKDFASNCNVSDRVAD